MVKQMLVRVGNETKAVLTDTEATIEKAEEILENELAALKKAAVAVEHQFGEIITQYVAGKPKKTPNADSGEGK